MKEQKVLIDLDECSNLNEMTPDERSLTRYLRSFGSLWEKESNKLSKDLNNAMLNVECMKSNHSQKRTSSTFKSRVSGANGSRPTKLSSINRELLKVEIVIAENSHALTLYLLAFDDKIISYAHQFVSKLCFSSWYSLALLIGWKRNDIHDYQSLIRVWRGQCIPKKWFMPMKKIRRDLVSLIAASLLYCDSSESGGDDFFNVRAAYDSVGTLQKANSGFMF